MCLACPEVEDSDGMRFLVERLWPRGMKKENLIMDAWLKDVAPSSDLRRWYAHDVQKWEEFQRRYRSELEKNADGWEPILEALEGGNVTLLYSARDVEHKSTLVLKSFLEDQTRKCYMFPKGIEDKNFSDHLTAASLKFILSC